MIDETARIHPEAKVAASAEIGPWTLIEAGVEIGDDCKIDANVIIRQGTKMGKRNKIHPYVLLGEEPQYRNLDSPDTRLEIGDDNLIREFTAIHRGTPKGGGVTQIGNNNYIMGHVHIAHDCHIGNNVTFVNNAALAGHVEVDDYATIGADISVHQFCNIGAYSFVSRFAKIGADVLPYLMVCGTKTEHATTFGINKEGLRRAGFSLDAIKHLHTAYKIIFRRELSIEDAVVELEKMVKDCPEVQRFLDGIARAQQGRKFVR